MPDLPDYYSQFVAPEAEAYKFRGGADASKSADPTARDIYFATDTKILYICVVDGVWTGLDAATLTQGILTLYANMAGGGFQIKDLADPTLAQDAATKAYVEALGAIYLLLTGGTMTGAIAMGANKITGLADPTLAQDAATRAYVLAQGGLYLPLTGGTLTGDLNIGANKLKTTNLLLRQYDVTTLAIRNVEDTAFCSLQLLDLRVRGNIRFVSGMKYISAPNSDGDYTALYARDNGVGLVEIARLMGAADPYFQLTLPCVLLPASEPGTLVEGHFWYDATADKLKYKDAASVKIVAREDLYTALTTFNAHKARHQNGGDDEISVAGLSGLLADDQHVLDAEAVSAMGAKADANPLHHDRYTDGEAGTAGVAAVEAAGLALASGKNIKVISALTADHTWSGLTAVMTAGTALVRPQAVYVGGDSKMEKALATAAATMPAIALATGTIAENASGEFLLQGYFRDDTWDWTPGGLLYVSKDTAGALTQTLPAASGEQVQVVGVAITADIIYFNPSLELVEIS